MGALRTGDAAAGAGLGRAGRAPLPLDDERARPVRWQWTSRQTTGATRSKDGWSASRARYSREYGRITDRRKSVDATGKRVASRAVNLRACPSSEPKARYECAPT